MPLLPISLIRFCLVLFFCFGAQCCNAYTVINSEIESFYPRVVASKLLEGKVESTAHGNVRLGSCELGFESGQTNDFKLAIHIFPA